MSDAQLNEWVKQRIGDYKLKELHLKVKPGCEPYAKFKGYPIQSGLREAVFYALA